MAIVRVVPNGDNLKFISDNLTTVHIRFDEGIIQIFPTVGDRFVFESGVLESQDNGKTWVPSHYNMKSIFKAGELVELTLIPKENLDADT